MYKLTTAIILLSLLSATLKQCTNSAENQSNSGPEIFDLNYTIKAAVQYITAEGTELRLSPSGNLSIEPYDQPDEHFPTVILDPDKQFQLIEGFGGALTDASAETFYKLPVEKQDELIKAYFDPEEGLGYSLCRTHINSCDFSSESYAYSEVPGDSALEHFSIEHDLTYRVPLIKLALDAAGADLRLFASPWSPPAWMKTNNHMLRGGKLLPEYNQAWADYYVKFFEAYKEEGIEFWGLTVQNEPMATQTWESCLYTAEEERDFVKNYLGPAIASSKFKDHKIIIYDHNRGVMYQRAATVYDDPEASKYVWGTGFHWYTGDHFENLRHVNDAFPDKKMLFTEGCVYPFDFEKMYEWHWGERYGESIIHDLNNYSVGWVDWNILLDETGGPNHVSNFCYAPVIGDTRTGELHYMNSFYYLGHFSKFIRPGARKIVCSSNNDDILATAFINPDGTIAVAAMNMTGEGRDFKIWLAGQGVPVKLPSHSITTVVLNQ